MSTTTTDTRPDLAAARRQILINHLVAAGWTATGDGRGYTAGWVTGDARSYTLETHEAAGRVVVMAGPDGRPLYAASWIVDADELLSIRTADARRALDALALVGAVPAPAPLFADDLAQLFTVEAERIIAETGRKIRTPVSAMMVYDAQQKTQSGARYANNPMPLARYVGKRTHGARPFWHVMDVPALLHWYRSRPGQGANAGRPAAAPIVVEPQELRADRPMVAWDGEPTRKTARGHGIHMGVPFLFFAFGDETRWDEPSWAVIESYAGGFFTLAYQFGDEVLKARFSTARKFWALPAPAETPETED